MCINVKWFYWSSRCLCDAASILSALKTLLFASNVLNMAYAMPKHFPGKIEHKTSKNFYFKSNNTAIDATQAIRCRNINETHLNYCPIDKHFIICTEKRSIFQILS